MARTESAAVEAGQNPHAVREPKENNLEQAIGHEVRMLRKQLGLTVTDVAAATGISVGMLSKIENGNISPSLTTLQSLSRALGAPLTAFFRRFEEKRGAVFVPAGQGVELERRGNPGGRGGVCSPPPPWGKNSPPPQTGRGG